MTSQVQLVANFIQTRNFRISDDLFYVVNLAIESVFGKDIDFILCATQISALLAINSKMIIQRSWVDLYETIVGHFQFYNHPSVISAVRFVGLLGVVESLQPYVDQVNESIKSLNVTEDLLIGYLETLKAYSLTSWKLAYNFIRPYKPAINPLIGKVRVLKRHFTVTPLPNV